MELDILHEIRDKVDKALAEGTTFEAFRGELEPFLRWREWWSRQHVVDLLMEKERVVIRRTGTSH